MKNIRFHQGDVIGASIDAISDRTKHAHVLTGNVERYEVGKRVIYKVNEESTLQHVSLLSMDEESYRSPTERKWEDHKPIRLSPGIYEFWIQQTYNPYTQLMEDVRD